MKSSFLAVALLVCGLVSVAFGAETAAPRLTPGQPHKVAVRFNLLNIPEIQEPTETFVAICYLQLSWRDPSLAFEGDEPRVLFEDEAEDKVKEIWRPNVQFANQTAPADTHHTVLTIKPDGTVGYDREMQVSLSSDLELHGFPFDRQTLNIELESFGYPTKALMFDVDPRHVAMAKSISLAQWRLGQLRWKASIEHDDLTEADYHRVTVSVDVRRNAGFYIWQIFVPLFLLISIASAVFFLPAGDLADRMNVVVTSLLTAVALSYAVHADLPKISYLTLVDRLFVIAYVFLGAKIAVMLWVKQTIEAQPERAETINRRARMFFPLAYLTTNAVIIAMNLAH